MIMTEPTGIPANWGKLKDQVVSWIDGENHCVTAQRISQSLDISRNLGSRLLADILSEQPNHQITTCQQSQEGNVTVFRLRTSTAANTDNSSVFALSSLDNNEPVEAAHERDMVQWREIVADQRFRQQPSVSAIAPAEQLKDAEDSKPVTRTLGLGEEVSSGPSSIPLVRPGKPNAKAKATTAASFFGGQKAQNNANKPAGATGKTAPNPIEKKKEIPKVVKKSKVAPVKVGNADDFVADAEDSDEEQVLPKRQPARLEKLTEEAKAPEPKSSPVRGAMDAFCNDDNSSSNQNKRQRKRRKKLVEKTTMVGGYLRTETTTVWEDVPSDEEKEEESKKKISRSKTTSAASKPKHGKDMKQKSLMGFFAKKK